MGSALGHGPTLSVTARDAPPRRSDRRAERMEHVSEQRGGEPAGGARPLQPDDQRPARLADRDGPRRRRLRGVPRRLPRPARRFDAGPSTTSSRSRPRRTAASSWSTRRDLPKGWTSPASTSCPGERPAWGIGMLTDDGRYVGLRQEDADVDELVSAYVDENAEPGDESGFESDLATGPWQTWADSGRRPRLLDDAHERRAEHLGDTLLVYGSAEPRRPGAADLAAHDGRPRLSRYSSSGLRGVEPLADAVEPLLADGRRGARRAPTAPATPRGWCRRPRAAARSRRAPRGPPRRRAARLGAGRLVSHRVSSRSSVRVVPVVTACTRPSATRTVIADSGATPATEVTTWPSASWSDGVAALAAWPAARGPGPGPAGGATSSWARSSRWPRRAPGPVRAARGPRRRARRAGRAGRASTGRRAQRVEPGLLPRAASRRAACRSRCAGRVDAGAAPRRRRGRRAWRRRSASRRGRRRPGRAAAGPARGRSRRRRACAARWTARTSASSENGSRSSTEPPPRATTMTSTSGCRSSRPSASMTSAAARWPCMVA